MNKLVLVADFETSVYDGQEKTEVWAAAFVPLWTEDVVITNSIANFFRDIFSLDSDLIIYFHNLKFDGEFIISYLFSIGFTNGLEKDGKTWKNPKKMRNNQFQYNISSFGQWYKITIKTNSHIIEIRDSLKLIPFSVSDIGESFRTKHKKTSIEYEGERHEGEEIPEHEKEYIANDVLVVKEALEIMYSDGHNKLTIGSCCMTEFLKDYDKKERSKIFPDLREIESVTNDNAWWYVYRSYFGGWCYVVEGKEAKVFHDGITLDVNSLYPSMMHSISGNRYPIGNPTFWSGNIIPREALYSNRYFFIRIKCSFDIKEGYLPFIKIKDDPLYNPRECLKSSIPINRRTGEYYTNLVEDDGTPFDNNHILTLTMTDYELFKEHYNFDGEILDGCYFDTVIGLFDAYIDKYMKIKMNSKGAERTEAKLFLNNLYGKMATKEKSDYKIARIVDGVVQYTNVTANDKTPGYIPIGSAITSYARNFTIRAAQKNYYGSDKPGTIYSDTDSIHIDLPIYQVKGVKIDDVKMCCWKVEKEWKTGYFLRTKSYIEIDDEIDIKCAGMTKECKKYLKQSMGYEEKEKTGIKQIDEFVNTPRSIEDFKVGLEVPGKLAPKRIPGGIVLQRTTFLIRAL